MASGTTSTTPAAMLAVVPVRDGVLPLGALETIAECGGYVLLAGSNPHAPAVAGVGHDVRSVELGSFQPSRWADAISSIVTGVPVIALPASPDGRDLAPHLAHRLGRPLLAGAIAVSPAGASLARSGGLVVHDVAIESPVVVTLQPGVRGVLASDSTTMDAVTIEATMTSVGREPELDELLPPDVATMDLSEAKRIVGGGAGLDSGERFTQLTDVAATIGAAMGATRVITDRGWVGHQRQIGTTGVVVDPELYVAFGISGAVQHTAGLGDPSHIISVNTDPHCPMMQMADLAVVADANGVLDEIQRLLGAEESSDV